MMLKYTGNFIAFLDLFVDKSGTGPTKDESDIEGTL